MPSILFETKDNIAIITFNRPEKLNAFNREMALLFREKLDYCQNDKSIRCVYITGSGKAFSATVPPGGPCFEDIFPCGV